MAHLMDVKPDQMPEKLQTDTLWPLRSLQAIAVAWIVLNQFREHLGLALGARHGLVAKGYLGAELFFVTAGFIAFHTWTRLREDGRLRQMSLLWRKLIRVWPLQVATLAAMGLLALAAAREGTPIDAQVFDPAAIPANLTLTQAWGVLPTVSWNFPSWLVSAEWFAAIVFPVTAVIVRAWRWPWMAAAAPVVLFACAFDLCQARHILFSDMTAQIGALQTVPAFLFGAGLCRFGQERGLSVTAARLMVPLSAAWIAAASILRLADPFIFPAFGLLALGLAERARQGRPLIAGPAWRYLGGLAYALMLVYLPVDIAFFHVWRLLFGAPHGAMAWLALAGVFPAILVAAIGAHHLVERPAYAWLRRLNPFPEPPAIQEPA
ncbi:acyltransferase family protein [Caulobacter sp. KR2-114]|uniref:acyltransferase family protein n=1 Tax=Caulobacter sp. KR2-114 TaxID=3400912 RepID=UPI003C0A5B54